MPLVIKKEKDEHYWNVLPKKSMEKFLKIAKKDWKKAVGIFLHKSKNYVVEEKLRGKLAEFMENQLDIANKSKVLDIGSGLGGLTIALARKFDVTASDTNPYTLKFIKYRAKQEKVKIKTKKIPQIHKPLPFKKKFDVVVMNGVLEWTAKKVKGNVENIHLQVLKNVQKVLKDKGIFILAIENRLAKDWFKGKPSHVYNIKYLDLLPRFLANWICKIKNNHPYRTYIYTKFGYKKLLKKAGFSNLEFYEAHPSYQKPKKIRKPKNLFVNSYIIVCRN